MIFDKTKNSVKMTVKETIRPKKKNKFQRHTNILMWKSYLQRQRRWRVLALETLLAVLLFVAAVLTAKPVFLTPLQDEPEPPLAFADLLASLPSQNLLGYAPNTEPYVQIMNRAAALLQTNAMDGATEDDLTNILYSKSQGTPLTDPIIWVIWKPKDGNMWQFSIRSTERARYVAGTDNNKYPNPHLRAGFLAVQLAVSQALVEHTSSTTPRYELNLVSMPVSPLMQETRVRRTLSGILLCFTLALLPPVLDTQALIVTETQNRFKRALRLRNVSYSSMYLSWLTYGYLTALPICLLGSVTLILIFRWIHLIQGLLILFAYVSVMLMLAMIMGMFHSKAHIACIWSTLFTLFQSYLAELLVHHKYDTKHITLTFTLHIILPPLGLVDAFNQFALLQTGRGANSISDHNTLSYTMVSWTMMIMLYFGVLMLLQRTIGQDRAIGGQVSWKSIIFKKIEDVNKLRPIEILTGFEREKLQEVDELVAKAISFRNVYKSIMGITVLRNITLDIYRGEYTLLLAERIQEKMINTIEDLLTGLTYADKGTINILGYEMKPGGSLLCDPQMMGYCHRSVFLLEDLTIKEHITLFAEICLWNETRENIIEYSQVRSKRLLSECDLESVRHERVSHLGMYYRAQLCWVISMLLEPRVVLLPHFNESPQYNQVIRDKILQHRKYVTIIKMCFSSIHLEYGDRVFWFDSKVLVFGGTPAYMFFKYGREYRVRMTLRSGSLDDEFISELLQRAQEAGASVRAHLGSLLILRLPTSPTATVAAFVKELMENSTKYGVTSLNISLPDSEEVSRRAINESRTAAYEIPASYETSKAALRRFEKPVTWTRKTSFIADHTQLRAIMWKYFSFYGHYKSVLTITIVSALVTGVFLGLYLSSVLAGMDYEGTSRKMLNREVITVEALKQRTTLALRLDNSSAARSVANAYVLSETNATKNEIRLMKYTALSSTESLTEYLVTRAIDSPQLYVYMFAYGLDVVTDENGTLIVQALYSPLHQDNSAAARSLARAYMALIRHYSSQMDASIQVTDDPLALDLSPWMKEASTPALFIQFLLIITISHIVLVPSKEHGLIRHMQSHAMSFSPAMYWFTMYLCDAILYWLLAAIMSAVMVSIMVLTLPYSLFQYSDLMVVPFMLVVYGMGCVPQAYIFSLGPRVTLNTMTFAIINIVFGETTILAKIFYGNFLDYALEFMSLSPQYNMIFAFVKINQIFLYNSECAIFKANNLCSGKMLHKCCEKCGVLQECFSPRSYLSKDTGILLELIAIIITAAFFMTLLMLIQYRTIQRMWMFLVSRFTHEEVTEGVKLMPGVEKQKKAVLEKRAQLDSKRMEKVDTFGEYLLVTNVSMKVGCVYGVRNVYLGLGKGEALALAGLKRHGRLRLCEMLAGYNMPCEGHIWCMSQWKLETQPHKYCRHVSFSCERDPLPSWMRVRNALELIAVLRGVPRTHVHQELKNLMEALDLHTQANKRICDVAPNDRTRLNFAAAVVGAPPIIVLDECVSYQKFCVRRSIYHILHHLRKRGHAIFISSSNVESHMPVTNRLAIMVDGRIFDMDTIDNLVERYSNKGYTVVVHLKDEVNINEIFGMYFKHFVINDTSEVLVNVQVLDTDLTWATVFERMETLQAEHQQIYSYIVSAIPIDNIYNSIQSREVGNEPSQRIVRYIQKFFSNTSRKEPERVKLDQLLTFQRKFDVTRLRELPWSVIFNSSISMFRLELKMSANELRPYL